MDWFLVADIKELLVIVRHDNGMAVTLKKKCPYPIEKKCRPLGFALKYLNF